MTTTDEAKTSKRCWDCKQWKPMKSFGVHHTGKGGRVSRCRACVTVANYAFRVKRYGRKNVKSLKAIVAHRAEVISARRREDIYGMSEVEFNQLCDSQGFSCAICRGVDIDTKPSKYPGRARTLNIDHDHRHKGPGVKVRGLLCGECNTGLGKFKDSLGLLRAAAQYLLDHG